MNRLTLTLTSLTAVFAIGLMAPAAVADDNNKPRIRAAEKHRSQANRGHRAEHRRDVRRNDRQHDRRDARRHDRRNDRHVSRHYRDQRRHNSQYRSRVYHGPTVFLSLPYRSYPQSYSSGYSSSRTYTTRSVRNSNTEYTYEYVPVVHVEPVLRYVTVRSPERECWQDEVPVRRSDYDGHDGRRGGSAGATIAGTLIGGAIGRQFGGGSGRDAATIAGALIGAAVGRDSRRSEDGGYEQEVYSEEVRLVERCETRQVSREEERVDGYRVTYLYNGTEYTTRTTADPGQEIRVRVSISPERY